MDQVPISWPVGGLSCFMGQHTDHAGRWVGGVEGVGTGEGGGRAVWEGGGGQPLQPYPQRSVQISPVCCSSAHG
jgi:hypothetical protein